MPTEGETRPCTHEDCNGTMRFSHRAKPPGWTTGWAAEGGRPVWGAEEHPGWECSADRDHFEPLDLTVVGFRWNTVPSTYGGREMIEAAITAGIGESGGRWTVTCDEPHNATRWDVFIDSADGRQWRFMFSGPEGQTAEFIRDSVNKAIG